MPRQIILNAFEGASPTHLTSGLWRWPGHDALGYKDLNYWIALAKTLEAGGFDTVFLTDVIGVSDVHGGSVQAALRRGVRLPLIDPLQVIPAMAAVTQNLGFALTASISYEHPFPFARRISSLDHLTNGRIGWNIVTSFLDSGARGLGQASQLPHDQRYDIADDYLDVCYKLWEGSWEDGAVLYPARGALFADDSKVHAIRHEGPYFNVSGIHLAEPSPQRTPLLVQAGTSTRGRAFAARHAETVFVTGPTKAIVRGAVEGVVRSFAAAGRRREDVAFVTSLTVIVDETDEAARRQHDIYRRYADPEGALVLMSSWMGSDLSRLDPDQPLAEIESNAVQTLAHAFASADLDESWTVRKLAEWAAINADSPVVVGSPATVADAMEDWIADTDVDGFNLPFVSRPGTFENIVRHLVPELRRRGIYKDAYRDGALRNKLFGRGDRLSSAHRAASFRHPGVEASREGVVASVTL